MVIMLLWGAGPGSYLDFSRLSFHVPLLGSLAWADTRPRLAPSTIPRVTITPSMTARRMTSIVPSFLCVSGQPSGADPPPHSALITRHDRGVQAVGPLPRDWRAQGALMTQAL